jgi:hypothetical protein
MRKKFNRHHNATDYSSNAISLSSNGIISNMSSDVECHSADRTMSLYVEFFRMGVAIQTDSI